MRFTVIATILLVTSVASADEAKEQATKRTPTDFNDYLFPKTGRVSATVATGAPFAAIGELSVGVANRFAVGAMVGEGFARPFTGDQDAATGVAEVFAAVGFAFAAPGPQSWAGVLGLDAVAEPVGAGRRAWFPAERLPATGSN